MREVVARGEPDLEAAPIGLNKADKAFGPIWCVAAVVELRIYRHTFQRVHEVRDRDFLRATHRAVIARYAEPGRVAP